MTNGRGTMAMNMQTKRTSNIYECFTKDSELGKKADQILGDALIVVDYHRQPSIDFPTHNAPRINVM